MNLNTENKLNHILSHTSEIMNYMRAKFGKLPKDIVLKGNIKGNKATKLKRGIVQVLKDGRYEKMGYTALRSKVRDLPVQFNNTIYPKALKALLKKGEIKFCNQSKKSPNKKKIGYYYI